MKTIFKKTLLVSAIITAVAIPFVSYGAQQLIPDCALGAGRCHLNDIIQTFINFGRMLLGLVGSSVLVFFIYGGFVWLTSGGSSEKIKKGKDIVVNSIIGLIIVFGAFTIIQFVSDSLGANDQTRIGQTCTDTGGTKSGFYMADVNNPTAPPTCVTECTNSLLSGAGYSCIPPATGQNCLPNLCGTGSNVCCQR